MAEQQVAVTWKFVADDKTRQAIEKQYGVKCERAFTYNADASRKYRETAKVAREAEKKELEQLRAQLAQLTAKK